MVAQYWFRHVHTVVVKSLPHDGVLSCCSDAQAVLQPHAELTEGHTEIGPPELLDRCFAKGRQNFLQVINLVMLAEAIANITAATDTAVSHKSSALFKLDTAQYLRTACAIYSGASGSHQT